MEVGVIQEGKGFAINNTYTVPNNENINTNLTKILVPMCLKDKARKTEDKELHSICPNIKLKAMPKIGNSDKYLSLKIRKKTG